MMVVVLQHGIHQDEIRSRGTMPNHHLADPKRSVMRPTAQAGVADTGRIVRLFVGQGYGFIRRVNDAEVYFHRSDVREGTSINDFEIGDLVTFERLDDQISGARAVDVRRHLRLVQARLR